MRRRFAVRLPVANDNSEIDPYFLSQELFGCEFVNSSSNVSNCYRDVNYQQTETMYICHHPPLKHSLNLIFEIANKKLGIWYRTAGPHIYQGKGAKKKVSCWGAGETRSHLLYKIFEQIVFTGMNIRFELIGLDNGWHFRHEVKTTTTCITKPARREQFGAKSVSWCLPTKSASNMSTTIR